MVHCFRNTLIILVCAMLTVLVVAQEEGEATDLPREGNIVLVDSAFVRGGPGNDYEPIGALFEGDEVYPLNISEDEQWILIPYSRGSGWVGRSLVRWQDEFQIENLPILASNVTPTPRIAITNTPFVPTSTPEGNYVNVEGAASAYVRAGPGRGYLRLGQVLPGENVEAVARNEDATWIMIRFSNEPLLDGFGWLARELVYWEDFESLNDLAVVEVDNLTPTITFTPSVTVSITAISTITPTVTETSAVTDTPQPTDTATSINPPVATLTLTPDSTETATLTSTLEPTATYTVTASPTDVPTATEIPSETATLTDVPTDTPTATDIPSETPSETTSPTDAPTETSTLTVTPLPTETAIPTETATETATHTATAILTATPENTPTEIIEAVVIASDTAELSLTNTATASNTPAGTATPTQAVTDIFAMQETSVAVEVTNNASLPPEIAILEESPQEESGSRLPVEAITGAIVLLFVLIYSWFYWQGLAAIGRYADGFVIEDCPVCQRGQLQIDERQSRIFGIPSARRTVRCDTCRSVLRQTGSQRWRYAVDRIENPAMYDRFNGREVTEADLKRLVKSPPDGAKARTSPEFVDNEREK